MVDALLERRIIEMVSEQQACEIAMQTLKMADKSDNLRRVGAPHLVSRDELVALAQAGHHAATLEPRNRREAAAEEDALDGSERDESLAKRYALVKRCALVGYPSRRPVGFLLYAIEMFNGVEHFFSADAK